MRPTRSTFRRLNTPSSPPSKKTASKKPRIVPFVTVTPSWPAEFSTPWWPRESSAASIVCAARSRMIPLAPISTPSPGQSTRSLSSVVSWVMTSPHCTCVAEATDGAIISAARAPQRNTKRFNILPLPRPQLSPSLLRGPARVKPLCRTQLPQLVADPDRPSAHDVGAQAPAVYEALQHPRLRQLLQVAARVAQPVADRLHLSHGEAPADEVV